MFEDPALQQACRPVADVKDHVRLLLGDLADTMKATKNCTALAGNQVGIMRRICVVDTDIGVQKLVNPVIVEKSGLHEALEDCVCFKDIEGYVFRPQRIVLEALNENGEKVTVTAEDAEASVYSHLIDHLDGKILVKEIIRFVSTPLEGE
jgi:peptide deformylase